MERGGRHTNRVATSNIGEMRSDSGSGAHLYNVAVFANVRETAAPPVERYEHWLSSQRVGVAVHGLAHMTATKLRRAVVMRRGGQTLADIASATGLSTTCVSRWLKSLPEDLSA